MIANFGKTGLAGKRNKKGTDVVEYWRDNEATDTGGQAGDDETLVLAELLGSSEAWDVAV